MAWNCTISSVVLFETVCFLWKANKQNCVSEMIAKIAPKDSIVIANQISKPKMKILGRDEL